MKEKLDESFWTERYKSEQTGWDVGSISTPLKEYIDQLENKSQRILIPGCGNAHEADYLLKKGFTNVNLVDISQLLIQRLEEKFYPKYEEQLSLLHGDFFEVKGLFDLIIEQTFFCALDPKFRARYAQKMKELLPIGGKLVGLMFNRDFEHDGPPFGGSREEYLNYFKDDFELKYFTDCYNSVAPRQGHELFVCLIRK